MTKKAFLLLASALLCLAQLALGQGSAYPDQRQNPANPPASASAPGHPQNPANPSTQMPPDTRAPVGKATGPTANAAGAQLNAGTQIRATLDTPLTTRTSHSGDQFAATVSDPVTSASGVAIPAGAKLHGEIVSAQPARSLTATSAGRFRMVFQDITLPGGVSVPVAVTLLSVAPSGSAVPVGEATPDGYVAATDTQDVNLPANTSLVLRLDQPLSTPVR